MGVPTGFEGPLAEYTALRQEIEGRSIRKQSIFVAQLTLGGAIFGFALSAPGRSGVLLVAPVIAYLLAVNYIAYLLAVNYAAQFHGVNRIATYMRESLGPKVPGGLGWDDWLRSSRPNQNAWTFLSSSLLAFSGAGIIGVIGGASFALGAHGTPAADIAFIAVWIADIAATIGTTITVVRIPLHNRHWWRLAVTGSQASQPMKSTACQAPDGRTQEQ